MKKEPQQDTAAFNCYDQFLITQYITERQNGVMDRIGSLVMCYRRFLKDKPEYIVDFMQTLGYRLPECHNCCRELASFRKSIRMDWPKTTLTKEAAREWISTQVRKGCSNFQYGVEDTPNRELAPMPGVPLFYNPDKFIEPEEQSF